MVRAARGDRLACAGRQTVGDSRSRQAAAHIPEYAQPAIQRCDLRVVGRELSDGAMPAYSSEPGSGPEFLSWVPAVPREFQQAERSAIVFISHRPAATAEAGGVELARFAA